MKKFIGVLALGIFALGLSAHSTRADEPVLSFSSSRSMSAPSSAATFSDATLSPSAAHEMAARDDSSDHEFRQTERFHHGVVFTTPAPVPQPVPEPSAFLLLISGCVGLALLNRKLVASHSAARS